jgi:hypothetical protein
MYTKGYNKKLMCMVNVLQCEDNKSSRRMQGKRVLAVNDTCKIELKSDIQLLHKAYEEALKKTSDFLSMLPIRSRSRIVEASIIQSCFAESLMENFPNKAFYGKFRRLILRVKGYLILFKKLDKKGYPMNTKTINVQSILNQNLTLDLFSDSDYNDEPILYFGYQKNRIGEYVNPQLIYIDEGEVKFSINESDMQIGLNFTSRKQEDNLIEVKPKLKINKVIKEDK